MQPVLGFQRNQCPVYQIHGNTFKPIHVQRKTGGRRDQNIWASTKSDGAEVSPPPRPCGVDRVDAFQDECARNTSIPFSRISVPAPIGFVASGDVLAQSQRCRRVRKTLGRCFAMLYGYHQWLSNCHVRLQHTAIGAQIGGPKATQAPTESRSCQYYGERVQHFAGECAE